MILWIAISVSTVALFTYWAGTAVTYSGLVGIFVIISIFNFAAWIAVAIEGVDDSEGADDNRGLMRVLMCICLGLYVWWAVVFLIHEAVTRF